MKIKILFFICFIFQSSLFSQTGTCLNFDGDNDFVQLTQPLSGNVDFTVEMWVRIDPTATGFIRFVGIGGTSTRFELGARNGNLTLFYFTASPGSQEMNGTNIQDNNWHHVAAVRSGGVINVYLDGAIDLQFTNVPNNFQLGGSMRVGRWTGGSNSGLYKGDMDEFRYWNIARNGTDIWDMRNCYLSGNEPNLEVYYDFDLGIANDNNTSIAAIPDLTPNGHDGQLVNFALTGNTSNFSNCQAPVGACLQTTPVSCGMAVMSCYSSDRRAHNTNGHVLGLIDVRDRSGIPFDPPQNRASSFSMYHHPNWDAQNLGEIYGIATDDNFNIYTAASTIYPINYFGTNTNNTGGEIHRINIFGNSAVLVRLPNSGQGLGNITYAKAPDGTHLLFATNWEDGMIYRINLDTYNGNPDDATNWTTVDPFGADDGTSGYAPIGELLWGIGYNSLENKLYFGRWMQNAGSVGAANSTNGCSTANCGNLFALGLGTNEIHAVTLDNSGNFIAATPANQPEYQLPQNHSSTSGSPSISNPVSDIAFSKTGKMLFSERSMCCPDEGGAHRADVAELIQTNGQWTVNPIVNFHIGQQANNNTPNGSNSAGGIAYGYDNFNSNDPNYLPECDAIVWATCDVGGAPINTYGICGLPAVGNTAADINSYHIDVAGSFGKRTLGDVEIFDCGCIMPTEDCTDLVVNLNATDAESCCYQVELLNNQGANISYVEAEILTNNVIFNLGSLANGYTWQNVSNQLISFEHSSGTFPTGTLSNVFDFCYGNVTNANQIPQEIAFHWYEAVPGSTNGRLICSDTLTTECNAASVDTCRALVNEMVSCDPNDVYRYRYEFQVVNNSTFTMTNVTLNIPNCSGVICTGNQCFDNNGVNTCNININQDANNNPLAVATGITSPVIVAYINTSVPILQTTDVCFSASLLGTVDDGLGNEIQKCCQSNQILCVELEPCCDPCGDISVSAAVDDQENCCFTYDIINDCEYDFFTKIKVESITSGVEFSSHGTGGTPGDWSAIATPTTIEWSHISGTIPFGNSQGIINYCLNGITDPNLHVPQEVVFQYITPDQNGLDSIACADTLTYQCPPDIDYSCVDIIDSTLVCDDVNNLYNYTITYQNNTNPPFSANGVQVDVINPTGAGISTTYQTPIVPPGQTGTVTLFFNPYPLPTGTQVEFEMRLLQDITNSQYPLMGDSCCFNRDTFAFTIPNCLSDCCQDQMVFDANVGNTFPFNVQCEDTELMLPQLDTCYWVEIDWGDNSPPTGLMRFPLANNPIHTYPTAGNYNVCVTYYEGEDPQNFCWNKQICETVTITDCCHCGGWDDMRMVQDGQQVDFMGCGDTVLLATPTSGMALSLAGSFNCIGNNCPTATITYDIRDASGHSIGTGNVSQGSMNIPMPPGLVSGIYSIDLVTTCGNRKCACTLWFELPAVSCPCPTPKPRLSVQYSNPSRYICKHCFNIGGLNACDEVQWAYREAGSLSYTNVSGVTYGNTGRCIHFPTGSQGDYYVQITVSRSGCINSTTAEIGPLYVNCTMTPTTGGGVIGNGGFGNGSTTGVLGVNGTSAGWNHVAGQALIKQLSAETESCAEGTLVDMAEISGVKDAIKVPVSIEAGKTYQLSFCFMTPLEPNPEFRQDAMYTKFHFNGTTYDTNEENYLNCTAGCANIGSTEPLQSTEWKDYLFSKWTAEQDYDYLTIYVEAAPTQSENDAPAYGCMDNISLREVAPDECDAPVIQAGTLPNQNVSYRTSGRFAASVKVPAVEDVQFRSAESITLSAGFSVGNGTEFTAMVEDCSDGIAPLVASNLEDRQLLNDDNRLKNATDLRVCPNPFRHSTDLLFTVAKDELVSLSVYHTNGELVKTLIDPKVILDGQHSIQFSPTNLLPGIYFVRLQTGGQSITKKLVLLK